MPDSNENTRASVGFLSIEDLVPHQGELTLTLDFDEDTQQALVEACTPLVANTTQEDIAAAYISLCDLALPSFDSLFSAHAPKQNNHSATTQMYTPYIKFKNAKPPTAIFAGKKYKPVALKICPIETELPSCFRIIRKIKGDPLENLPQLPTQPANFQPTGRYTAERKEQFDKVHDTGFLLPEERKLVHQFMCLQNGSFVWTDQEQGHFCEDFFPLIEIPPILHKPWAQRNIPIPPGIYNEVCRLIKNKINAGVYKPSNSSYRLRWFCIVKKDR